MLPHTKICDFIVIHCNYCYYLCLIPYTFRWHEHFDGSRKEVLNLQQNGNQKVIHIILTVLQIAYACKEIQKCSQMELTKAPHKVFELGGKIGRVLCVLSYTWAFWNSRKRFEHFVNFLNTTEMKPSWMGTFVHSANITLKRKSRWLKIECYVKYLHCIFFTTLAIIIATGGGELWPFSFSFNGFVGKMWCLMIGDASTTTLVSHLQCIHTTGNSPSIIQSVLSLLFMIGRTTFFIVCGMAHHLIFIVTLAINQICSTYSNDLKNLHGSVDLPQGFVIGFKRTRKTFRMVNHLLGWIILSAMIGVLVEISTVAVAFFLDFDRPFQKVAVSIMILHYVVTFLIASDAVYKVKKSVPTLLTPKSTSMKAMLYSVEATFTKIGLSGKGFFHINYSFTISIFITVLTYVAIVIQFNMSNKKF